MSEWFDNTVPRPAKHGWLITKDHLAEPGEESCVDTMGPHNITDATEKILRASTAHPDRHAFKVYDDDGELYFSGYYFGPDDERMFSPLWDYGTPAMGATDISYRNKETGKWEPV